MKQNKLKKNSILFRVVKPMVLNQLSNHRRSGQVGQPLNDPD